jgi:hypothetical protein
MGTTNWTDHCAAGLQGFQLALKRCGFAELGRGEG